MLLGCTGWFFCSSAVCGWPGSMKGLIFGRALQGVAGGGCVQLVTVTISDLFGMRKRSLVCFSPSPFSFSVLDIDGTLLVLL